MANLNKYVDEYNLLVGVTEDPGDSMHRTMMAYLGKLWFENNKSIIDFRESINNLKVDGKWVRHPSIGWWSDPDRISRDQATPLIIALSEYNFKPELHKFALEHLKRFGFFTNTRRNGATKQNHNKPKYQFKGAEKYNYNKKIPDFVTPEFIAIYIRALNLKIFYPALYILDIDTLVSSVIWLFKDKDNDILNHMLVTIYANHKYPTLFTKLSYKLLLKSDIDQKLNKYFSRIGMLKMCDMFKKETLFRGPLN